MEQVTEQQDSLEARVIKTLTLMDQDLPTIPVVLSQIMHMTASDDSSVRDLINVLNQDQALTARILRVANSAYYGLREKATTIERAVVILGFDMVRSLAVGASFIHYFSPKNQYENFDLNAFWAHTTAVGVFAEAIAQDLGGIDPGYAFTAGILHDIGKLVMLIYFEEEFSQVLARVAEHRLDFYEAETLDFGLNHASVGGTLLRHWHIPEVLAWAIEHHHQPLMAEKGLSLAVCVNLADFAARYIQIGSSGSPYLKPPSIELLKSTNLTAKDFKKILKRLTKKKDDVFKLISALD
ncbi:MAG: HDOD domain-containing protein [Deltaproteobacteria bacterium]|nr:HDOD domain-containing protein [Deltaproteobacteria bacterium]MBW2085246.1 HDOD domain-containing protein [Deltaproteobacteria bacterium]